MCKLSSSKYFCVFSSGQPRSVSTVPGMVCAWRQPLPWRASSLKKQMERNEALLSLFYRVGIKCPQSRCGSVASFATAPGRMLYLWVWIVGFAHFTFILWFHRQGSACLWTGLLQAGFPSVMLRLHCTGCAGAKGCNPPDLFWVP